MDWEFSRWIFVSRPCLPKNTVQKLGRIKHWCVLPCSFHGFDGLVRYQERRPALVPIQVSLIVVGEILWFLTCHQNGWEMEQKSLQKNTPFFHTQFFFIPMIAFGNTPIVKSLVKALMFKKRSNKAPILAHLQMISVKKTLCPLFSGQLRTGLSPISCYLYPQLINQPSIYEFYPLISPYVCVDG